MHSGRQVGSALLLAAVCLVGASGPSEAALTSHLAAAGFACPDSPSDAERARVLETFRPDAPHAERRLIVGLERTAAAETERERAKALRAAIDEWLASEPVAESPPAPRPRIESMHVYPRLDAVLLEFTGEVVLPKLARELAACPGPIRYVELDYEIVPEATIPNDRFWADQDSLRTMSVDHAWDLTTGSSKVVVAVIDNGFPLQHVDLKNNLWTNTCVSTADPNDDPCPGEVIGGVSGDLHGWNFVSPGAAPEPTSNEDPHGANAAGIIGAEGDNGQADCVAGISWDVSLVALKVIGGPGGLGEATKAVQYATAIPADVINASWSIEPDKLLSDAIDAAGQKEILVVAAAPRFEPDVDARPAARRIPCGLTADNVLCVTATDAADQLAAGAPIGAESVDLSATVTGIRTTARAPDGCIKGAETTSMAAPHVTGVAALLRARCPGISVAKMRERLLDGDPALAGLTVSGKRLNALKAVEPGCPQETEQRDPPP